MTATPSTSRFGSHCNDAHSLQMTAQFVRDEVGAFRERGAYGRADEDCFPAWYLTHRFGVAPSDAIAQTADGSDGVRKNYDFGLDAFHVVLEEDEPPTLVLVQAKFTESLSSVSGGLRDLQRALPRVAEALTCSPSTASKENRVLVTLRERLRQLDEETRSSLRLRFEVVHLAEADELLVRANTRKAYDDLQHLLASDPVFESWRFEIDLVGPARMGGAIPQPTRPPQIWHDIALDAVPLTVRLNDRDVTMYSGIGRLSDLVELYNQRRGDLFAKNVRYFLAGKQNEERGPSGKIKEALAAMCIPKRGAALAEPELFAFHHNGVTIFARDIETDQHGRIRRMRDPYVLNGCQTIKSAYDFRADTRLNQRIDDERWARVKIPVRILTTQQEELIRQITVSNNRQNHIPASALRANDNVQIDLERRLAQRGVFYERQEGALREFLQSNSERVGEFANSRGRAVYIDDLARCLAAAAGEFDHAHSPSRIFEYDAAYERVFAPERLASVTFIVLLQNLHDVLPAILKNDMGLEPTNPKGPKRSRLLYYTLCLLARHLAKNRMDDWAGEYGSELLGREKRFRDAVTRELSNYRSHIKQALKDHFLCLETTDANAMRSAFRSAAWSINLRDSIDVFGVFAALDSRLADD